MPHGQPTPLDKTLKARLVAACRPSEGSDCALESPRNRHKGSTLGSTLKYRRRPA